jgi:hypothetical protein
MQDNSVGEEHMHDASDGDIESSQQGVKNDQGDLMDDSKIERSLPEPVDLGEQTDSDNMDDPKADKLPGFILIKPQIVNFAIMVLSLGVVITAAVVRGGDGFKSLIGLNSCSFMGFAVLIGSQLLNFYLSRVAYNRNRSKIQKYEMTDIAHIEGTNI